MGDQSRIGHTGFDASWEPDLFGGTRRAVESADADIDALAHDNIHTLREEERLTEMAM